MPVIKTVVGRMEEADRVKSTDHQLIALEKALADNANLRQQRDHIDSLHRQLLQTKNDLKADNTQLRWENEKLKSELKEERKAIKNVWDVLGISTYEQSKPFTLWEHVKILKFQASRQVRQSDLLLASKSLLDAIGMFGPKGGPVDIAREALLEAISSVETD